MNKKIATLIILLGIIFLTGLSTAVFYYVGKPAIQQSQSAKTKVKKNADGIVDSGMNYKFGSEKLNYNAFNHAISLALRDQKINKKNVTKIEKSKDVVNYGDDTLGYYQLVKTAPKTGFVDFHDVDGGDTEQPGIKTSAVSSTDLAYIVTNFSSSSEGEPFSNEELVNFVKNYNLKDQGMDMHNFTRTKIGNNIYVITGYSDKPYKGRPVEFVMNICVIDNKGNFHAIFIEGPQTKAGIDRVIGMGGKIISSYTNNKPQGIEFENDIQK